MSTPEYTAVIVSFNAKEVLAPSLEALQAARPAPTEIIVVENGSTDGSAAMVQEKFPDVKLIEAGGNIGFGRGNNLGIAAARTPYVLLVNNDLKVEPDCPRLLLEALESNPKLAVASPLIYRGWDEQDRSDIYSFGSRIDEAGFTVNVETPPAENEASNCFSGACCLARTELFQRNPFEPHYFLYYEEPELMVRLAKQGFTTGRVAEAVAWHLESYSSPGKAAAALSFRQFYGIQNRWYALGKHWPLRLWPKAAVFNVLHFGYFLLFFARNKQWRYLTLLWLAPLQFLIGLLHRSYKKSTNPRWWMMLFPASLGGMLRLKKRVVR